MKSRNKWVAFAGLFFLLLTLCGWQATVMQQQAPSGPWPNVYDCVGTVRGNFCSYSATQLGMNALAYGSNGTTANTSVIDTRGVKAWTLLFNCTSLGTLQLNNYLEDGITSFLNVSVVTTTVAAQTSVTVSAGGTSYASQGSPGATTPNLPQRAMSFAFLNTNATAGTCTGRLFLSY